MNPTVAAFGEQLFWLFVLGIPVACIRWTVTHEDVFREPREWCTERSKHTASEYERMFFYLLTCEYCFSHYVAAAVTGLCKFRLLIPGWRGYFVAWLSLVWIANLYMSIFGRLRLDSKHERIEIAASENNPKPKEGLHVQPYET